MDRSRVEGSYDQVFQATLEVLRDRQFPIRRADQDAGRIVTGRCPVQAAGPWRSVETANAHVKTDDGDVTVRLLLGFFNQYSGRSRRPPDGEHTSRAGDVALEAMSRAADAGAVYDECLDAIEARVDDLRSDPPTQDA